MNIFRSHGRGTVWYFAVEITSSWDMIRSDFTAGYLMRKWKIKGKKIEIIKK